MNRCDHTIGWATYTWNPITGCLTGCDFCYAHRIATRFAGTKAFPHGFEPHYRPERLDEPRKLKKPSRIFLGSMTDVFGYWVKNEWIDAILEVIAACPQHTFMALTKWPGRIRDHLYQVTPEWPTRFLGGGDYLPNLWLGVSVLTGDAMRGVRYAMTSNPDSMLPEWPVLFVSLEPLLGWIQPSLLDWPDWVIVGAMTGPGAAEHTPKTAWVDDIFAAADKRGAPVYIKDNLHWPVVRRQWPEDNDAR